MLLATAAGSLDGWSYFGLGHAFVANMTGNTVLLGMSLAHVPAHVPAAATLLAAGYGARDVSKGPSYSAKDEDRSGTKDAGAYG